MLCCKELVFIDVCFNWNAICKNQVVMRVLLITFLSALAGICLAQGNPSQLRKIKNNAFRPGEELNYIVHYGVVNAGTATLKVEETDRKAFGQDLWRVVGTGQSLGAFNWFFKVKDRYETYIDKDGIFPWYFQRRIDEGGYKKNQDYVFYQHKKYADIGNKNFTTPDLVQDMLSAYYYARTFDMQNANPGEILAVTTFIDEEVWTQKIKYLGRETVSIRSGKYRCLKFVPVVQRGRIFKDEEDLVIYISDDENKIPILAKAEVLVGSIKMEFTGAKGLANPLAKVK